MRRAMSLEKTPRLGENEGRRRRGWHKMRWLDGITEFGWTRVWANSGRWWRTGSQACCSLWGHKESDTTERLNWTQPKLYGEEKGQEKQSQEEETHFAVCTHKDSCDILSGPQNILWGKYYDSDIQEGESSEALYYLPMVTELGLNFWFISLRRPHPFHYC